MTTDEIETLVADAACINSCIPQGMQLAVLIYLANQVLATGVANAAEIQADNYGGSDPTWTPTSGVGIAFDTSDGSQWNYYNGAWH